MPKCRPIPKALKMAETEMSADTNTEISAKTNTETDNFRSLQGCHMAIFIAKFDKNGYF
jgi:hypothetical protein